MSALNPKWDPHAPVADASKPLTTAELDGVERDLNKMGTPPDNVLRRMIAEIRRSRATTKPTKASAKPKRPKKETP